MKNNNTTLKLAMGLALAFTAGAANAATTDGVQGTTSTGTTDINVTISSTIIIKNVDAMSSTWTGTGDLQLTDDVCVGTNSTTGYTITASGDSAASAFELDNAGSKLSYAVSWAETSGQTTGLALATTVASVTQTTTESLACAADTATVIVDIVEADLLVADAGTHTGTLTLLVTPI